MGFLYVQQKCLVYFIFLFLLFIPSLSESNNSNQLKLELISTIEQNRLKFGEDNCCATDHDTAFAFANFDQSSIDFISLSIYQKIIHQCKLLKAEPKSIKVPDFKQNQIDFTVTYICVDTHTGYFNKYTLQLLVAHQRDQNTLELVGICEHQKDSYTTCRYNYFKQIYPEYNQTQCQFYKNNDAYALHQAYLKYKKDNAYPEFQEKENSKWQQIIHHALEKYSDFDPSTTQQQDQIQKEYEKASKMASLTIENMRKTDHKYQKQLIANQSLFLARQYQQRYFVKMDLVYDIEADLRDIRRQLVESGNVLVPFSGRDREDVRTINIDDYGETRLHLKSRFIKNFEQDLPKEIDCMNRFWGFNQLTIHARNNGWETEDITWQFYITLGGQNYFDPTLVLEYIQYDYFENSLDSAKHLLQQSSACNVGEHPKLALTMLDNDEQLYVYSSGSSRSENEKYYTVFQSSPHEKVATLANDSNIPECTSASEAYKNYFSY